MHGCPRKTIKPKLPAGQQDIVRKEASAFYSSGKCLMTYLRSSGRPGAFLPEEGGVPPGFFEGAEGLCMAGDFGGFPGRDGVTCFSGRGDGALFTPGRGAGLFASGRGAGAGLRASGRGAGGAGRTSCRTGAGR